MPILPPPNKSRQDPFNDEVDNEVDYEVDDEDEDYNELELDDRVEYEAENLDPSTISADARDEDAHPETINNIPRAEWDNGEEVTPEERVVLLAMDSDAERARAMILRRRDRESLADGLISHIPPICGVPVAEATKPAKRKTQNAGKTTANEKSKDSGKVPRRSARNSVNANTESVSVSDGPETSSTLTLTPTPTITTHSRLSFGNPAGPNDEAQTLPDWIEEAMSRLDKMCDGAMWTSILVKWIDMETQLGFPKGRVSPHFNLLRNPELTHLIVEDTHAV